MTLSWGSPKTSKKQIFKLRFIKVGKLQIGSSNGNNVTVGVTTEGVVLKSCSIWKVKNHGSIVSPIPGQFSWEDLSLLNQQTDVNLGNYPVRKELDMR